MRNTKKTIKLVNKSDLNIQQKMPNKIHTENTARRVVRSKRAYRQFVDKDPSMNMNNAKNKTCLETAGDHHTENVAEVDGPVDSQAFLQRSLPRKWLSKGVDEGRRYPNCEKEG
ncbi:hypothetical protein SNEBB_000265 [Seison nebaliae]|nr:hypothetical protein SNEBB_000265 [Seison nebaliae]